MIRNWKQQLKAALQEDLPGPLAHTKVAPADRIKGLQERQWPLNAKRSAVSFLLFPKNGSLHTLFMKRPEYPGVHSGQVSLPGGQKDPTDTDLQATAIREYFEETHVQLSPAHYLGQLTEFYIPPSNFLVQPYIAFIDELPPLIPQESEVASLHEVSLKELFEPACFLEEEIIVRNRSGNNYTIKAPCYKIKELVIWGATAMMISELEWIFRKYKISTLL
jgi:8-oxo-dGTP pyrophosphatase MutT (NUDIX family)